MTPTLVAVYSPDSARKQMLKVVRSIQQYIRTQQLTAQHILFNPDGEQIKGAISLGKYRHLVVSWTNETPDWNVLLGDDYIASNLKTVYLWCLSEGTSSTNSSSYLDVLRENTIEKIKSGFFEEARVRLTAQGYFISNKVPYGMKLVDVVCHTTNCRGKRTKVHRHRLEHGSPSECEVVRLIFDLYGCRNLSFTRIIHLLQAQGVPPPPGSATWRIRQLKRILSNPIYIGALRYRNLICSDAMIPMVEEWLFYPVQARRSMEKKQNCGLDAKRWKRK